jgi:hypothetical protein
MARTFLDGVSVVISVVEFTSTASVAGLRPLTIGRDCHIS